nr:uncharacterized protein C1orf105 homolog [Peromyscus maniculatus bairdii]
MDKKELKAFVPKFDKVPWLSEASLVNKPLVLSIPGRYHSSATVLTLCKKGMDLPNLLQVPDVIYQARKNKHENLSPRNKQLCSACREMKTVGKGATDRKFPVLILPIREMLLHHPDIQQFDHPCNDIPTESIRYRLPIMGPRTAVFHRLLSGAYTTPLETQHLSLPRKKLKSKTVKQ